MENAAVAAMRAEIVITMLPAGEDVRDVYLGPNGVIANANRGALLIDCSTIDVETAREVAEAAAANGHLMIDAPVSGGVGGATGGHAHLHGRRSEEALAKAKPILEAMGKTIVHAGRAGNGQAAKICNNMILGISMIAVSEAFLLAEKLGLDAQKLFDISSKSSGQCWSMTIVLPGARPGADLARQPRLCRGLHRHHDAQGSEARAGCRARRAGRDPARGRSRRDLRAICRKRRGR